MALNQQPPEKRVNNDGTKLAVNSIFHTIQGEGPFAGSPAVFVRLAGCNLQCPACDTQYTNRLSMDVTSIVETVIGAHAHMACTLVVITGGEPFRQNITMLVRSLGVRGYRVQIETNGTLPPPPHFPIMGSNVTVVCSPKAGQVHRELVAYVSAWKYVADEAGLRGSPNGLPSNALHHPTAKGLYHPPAHHRAPIFLQPMDSQNAEQNKRNTAAVVRACLEHGHRLCLQMHKIVGVE